MIAPRSGASWLLVATLATLAACSVAPPPAVPPPAAPAPPPAPPPVAPPQLGLVVTEEAPRAKASTSAAVPSPLGSPFERLPLPSDATMLVAVEGRDPRDVWLLSQSALFHWDGAGFTEEKGPACKQRLDLSGLALTPDAVIALGAHHEFEGSTPLEVPRSGRGRWACDRLVVRQRTIAVGPGLLGLGADGLTLSGLALPYRRWLGPDIAARTAEDLWVHDVTQGDAFHGNGVSWESRPTGLARVLSLRIDATGVAWLVGATESKGEGDVVLRWDLAAHAWSRVPTPADLRASRVRVSSGRDVWLVGDEHVHHWDGQTLRRGGTPLARVEGAWVGASGALWLVGGDRRRPEAGKPIAGVAFRVPPPLGEKP